MEIIKKNKKLFLKTILFFSMLIFVFIYALSNIANDNVERQEHRKVISEEIQKNKYEAWQGTAVPNTGYVENVYFNIDLSVDEVINYLYELAPYVTGNFIYLLNDNVENLIFIRIEDFSTQEFGIYNMLDFTSSPDRLDILFLNNYTGGETNANFQGWNPNFNGIIEIDRQVTDTFTNSTPNVGLGNELISNLFSVTPFEEPKSVIEIIGNGIADAAGIFGEVLTFGFEAIKKVIFNADNTLTYTGSVIVIIISTAMISLAFRMVLKAFGFIKVG